MDAYTREWRDALSCAMPHPLRLRGLLGEDVDLAELQAGVELEPNEPEEGSRPRLAAPSTLEHVYDPFKSAS